MTFATLVDWGSLGDVAAVSAAIGISITLALSVAVRATLLAQDATAAGEPSKARLQMIIAITAVFVSVAVFILGIYEIASK